MVKGILTLVHISIAILQSFKSRILQFDDTAEIIEFF